MASSWRLPWRWVVSGWRDFCAAPLISLGYSAPFALLGSVAVALLSDSGHWLLLFPLLTGFMLTAPLLAVGYYGVAERLRRGQPPRFADLGSALRRRRLGYGVIGALMGFLLFVWLTDALLIYVLYFGETPAPAVGPLWHAGEGRGAVGEFLFFAGLTGFVLAVALFLVAAFAVPRLYATDCGVVAAVMFSVRTVVRRPVTMALWGGLLTALTWLSLLLPLPLLLVAFPTLSYGSYAAYQSVSEGATANGVDEE